jgi:hypothetical protein
MSRKKLSKSDYAALNKGQVVRSYPAKLGGGRAQLRMQGPPSARRGRGR